MIAANAKLQSEIVPHILSENIVDVCDSLSKRRVIFFVVIDKINRSDSLYGYDLEIKYDTAKLKIINYVKGNTLSEFFDIDFSYGLNGSISGYGYAPNVLGPPSYGDSLLVGFLAEWLSNCPDTANLTIEDLNFTSEFKYDYDSLAGGSVIAIKKQNSNVFDCSFQDNEMTLQKGDSIVEVKLSIKLPEYHNTNDMIVKYNLVDTLMLTGAIVNTSNGKIQSIDSINNSIIIDELARGPNEIMITSYFKIMDINKLDENFLRLISVQGDECSCVFNFKGDTILFLYDDTLDVRMVKDDNQIVINAEYVEIHNNWNIQSVEVYDYMGNRVDYYEIINKSIIKIYLDKYNEGIYFLYIKKYDNNNEIKKIYKYYSN